MTRSYIRACIVAVVLTAGTTRVSAEQLAVGNDTEPGMSGSPSVAAIGVDHVAMRRDHDSTQKGTLLQQALRVQAASLARTGAQLQSTKLNNDRKTKLIIINSPENPTGGVLDRGQIERIARIATERNIPVMTDEIYRQFLYDGEFVSFYAQPGMHAQSILLDGFSKTFAMTGWRLGYGVMPTDLAEHVTRLMVNSNSCTASFVQLAGVAALQGDHEPVRTMVAEFKRRRDILVDGLNKLPGVTCKRPRGAFYVFPNITGSKRTSAEVADRLLQEAGVAVLSGAAFGAHGEGYLRISYANSETNLRKALERMRPLFESFAR